jgi:hypothetical protein
MPERARVATGLYRSAVQKIVVFNEQTTPYCFLMTRPRKCLRSTISNSAARNLIDRAVLVALPEKCT